MRELHAQVKRALEPFDRWSIRHVRREENADADRLVNEALDGVLGPPRRGKVVGWRSTASSRSIPASTSVTSTSKSPTWTAPSSSTAACSASSSSSATARTPPSSRRAATTTTSASTLGTRRAARRPRRPAPASTTSRSATRPAAPSPTPCDACARPAVRIEGASDHGVSEALYLSDPDGNGIELYWDRPKEEWPEPQPGQKVEMCVQAARPPRPARRAGPLSGTRGYKAGLAALTPLWTGWPRFPPDADALPDVDDVVEAFPLEDRRGEAAALAAAADRRDRPIAGQLAEPPRQVAVGDVERTGNVLRGVLGRVADVEHQRRLGPRGDPPAPPGRSARSAAPAGPRAPRGHAALQEPAHRQPDRRQ